MIEQKQLFLHKPEEGLIGDCFRTCIACVLNLDPEAIPHYYKQLWQGKDINVTPEVREATNNWLSKYGVLFVETPLDATMEQLGTYLKHYYTNMYVIIGCNSKNGGHSVVMKNDDYMWDPSIDNSGCVGPMDDGYYWIGLILEDTRDTK